MANEAISITTKEGIALYRLLTLKSGLGLEMKGMRLTRGRTCYAILKSEYGFKGNKAKVMAALIERLDGLKAMGGVALNHDKETVPATLSCGRCGANMALDPFHACPGNKENE